LKPAEKRVSFCFGGERMAKPNPNNFKDYIYLKDSTSSLYADDLWSNMWKNANASVQSISTQFTDISNE